MTKPVHSEQDQKRAKPKVKLPPQDIATAVSFKPVQAREVFIPPATFIPRVPSPLLYHKRSNAVFTDSAVQDSDPIAKRSKFDQERHDQLMTEIKTVKRVKSITSATHKPFVAARLPCMSPRESSQDSEDGGVLLKNTATACVKSKHYVRSTKPARCPAKSNRIYHIFSHGKGAHSGFAFGQPQQSCKNINFIFPKLLFSSLSSDFDSPLNSHILLAQTSLPDNKHEWCQPASSPTRLMLESPPFLSDTRERSSTQDSFNSRFDVATAMKASVDDSFTSLSQSDITQLGDAVQGSCPSARLEATTHDSQDEDFYFDAAMFSLPKDVTNSLKINDQDEDFYFDPTMFDLPVELFNSSEPKNNTSALSNDLDEAFLSESEDDMNEPFDDFAHLLLDDTDTQASSWEDEDWETIPGFW